MLGMQIRPCPFCGDNNLRVNEFISESKAWDWSAYSITCEGCGCGLWLSEKENCNDMLKGFFTEMLIEKWNQRSKA